MESFFLFLVLLSGYVGNKADAGVVCRGRWRTRADADSDVCKHLQRMLAWGGGEPQMTCWPRKRKPFQPSSAKKIICNCWFWQLRKVSSQIGEIIHRWQSWYAEEQMIRLGWRAEMGLGILHVLRSRADTPRSLQLIWRLEVATCGIVELYRVAKSISSLTYFAGEK